VGRFITGRGVAILLAALTLVQAIPPAAPEAPPESGVWYIDGDATLQNGTFYLYDDVQVNSSGSLTVNDALLVCNASYIRITVYGRLVMDNTSVAPSDPANYAASVSIDYGVADLRRSSFDNIWFDVRDGRARFTSCDFTGPVCYINQYTYGMAGYGLIVDNCTFVGRRYSCIMSNQCSLAVIGSRFFRDESYWVDSIAREGTVEAPREGARVRDNRLIGLGTGIRLESDHYYNIACAISADSSGQTAQLICNNTIAGFDYGVYLAGDDPVFEITGNDLLDCKMGIDASNLFAYSTDVVISGNIVEGGVNGILAYPHNIVVDNNTISNCTNSGFYGSYTSAGGDGLAIRDNTVTGCPYGAYLSNAACEFSSNNISNCSMAGIYAYLRDYTIYQTSILNNTVINCGFYDGPVSFTPAGISAIAESNCRIQVSGNRLQNGSVVGIWASGNVGLDSNTVEGAATGIVSKNYMASPQEIARNRVSGGEAGISILGVSKVIENDISDVRSGILCILLGYDGELQFSSNAVHASDRGIEVRNPLGAVRTAAITQNVIAAGIDGILVDSVGSSIKGNDFGGTRGVCVHAIGQEPELSTNRYGSICAGHILQEWYLTVRALQSPDPYNSANWYFTDRYTVRIRNDTGALALNTNSGGSTTLSANLTGYTVDQNAIRTNFTRYTVSVMKPHVGVGWAPATLVENAAAGIQLFPRADLAVQDIALPGGRPLPGQTVTVEVSVVHDTTYDTFFTYLGAVNVALRDNGMPIGEKLIARLEPNATAVLRFGWSVSGGPHELTAIVDPDMRIAEAFEDNNVFTRRVFVNEVPVPVLSCSDTNPAVGRTVAFSSVGSMDDTGVARSLFEFGDGTDSGWTEDVTVLHVYSRMGIYEARLRVADAENVTSDWSLPEYITVTEGTLEATLTANSTSFDTLVPVLLSASPEGPTGSQHSFAWDFGDGASELGWSARQVHTYSRAGNFTAGVTVTDPMGQKGSATILLTVRNRRPEAALAYSPAEPTVLVAVRFSSISGDPDGVVGRWRWDFGDGNRSTDPAPRHLYHEKGDFTVTLEVQDDSGAWSAAAVKGLAVQNIPPAARASPSSVTVHAGEAVLLDAGLTEDPDDDFHLLTFRWTSLDGWSSDGPNASTRYRTPGRYRITLTVSDGSGASSQDTVTVQVLPVEDAGGLQYRALAMVLSVSAVAVFLVALLIYGRDRTGPARTTTLTNGPVKRVGGKRNNARTPPASSRISPAIGEDDRRSSDSRNDGKEGARGGRTGPRKDGRS